MPNDRNGRPFSVLSGNLDGEYHFVKINSNGELGVILPLELVTQAVSGIDVAHKYVHSGIAYSAQYLYTISNGATSYTQFTTPAGSPYIHLKPSSIQTDGPKIVTDILEGPDAVSNGTLITPLNRNRNFPDASQVVVKRDVGISLGAGKILPADYIGGGTGTGGTVRTGGGCFQRQRVGT